MKQIARAFFGGIALTIFLIGSVGSEAANTSGNMAADARAAEERGDHVTAFRIYRQLAESGSADAQVIVGMDYENGKGAPQSFEEAAKWYRRAAEQGQVYGQLMLGILYATGRGVPHDPEQSAKWYRRAAEQGDARGQWGLGLLYANGTGVIQDYITAYKWLNLAVARAVSERVESNWDSRIG
jgi:TPR repeat protein